MLFWFQQINRCDSLHSVMPVNMRLLMTLLHYFPYKFRSSDKLWCTDKKILPINNRKNIYILHELLMKLKCWTEFYEQFQPISMMKTCFFCSILSSVASCFGSKCRSTLHFTIAFTWLSNNVRQKSSSWPIGECSLNSTLSPNNNETIRNVVGVGEKKTTENKMPLIYLRTDQK